MVFDFFGGGFFPGGKRPKANARLKRLVQKSGYFDPEWYLLDNVDVARAGVDPLDHFCVHGDREKRSPGPRFNAPAYARAWPDVSTSGMGPLEHFLRVGRAEGRVAPGFSEEFLHQTEFRERIHRSGLFDPDWYRERNRDLRDPEIDVLGHLAFFGAREGRDPGPNFSNVLYRLTYSEHIDVEQSPLEHFLFEGRSLGLEPLSGSAYEIWSRLFDRVEAEDRDLMRRSAEKLRLPVVDIVHVFDAEACRRATDILDALREQVVDNWTARIVFADDVSDADRAAVEALVDKDARIRVVAARARGALETSNEFVLLIHGCARLAPHAIYLFSHKAISAGAEFVYGDHDYWTEEGERCDPAFKPVFSPEYLRNRFYIGPCLLIRATPERRELATRAIDDFCAHRCDELSRALLAAPRGIVAHVPFVVCGLSTNAAELTRDPEPSSRATLERRPSVSLIVATRDRIELLRDCIDSIEKNTLYPRELLEIVVVDNGSRTEEAALYFDDLRKRAGFKVVADPGRFNFARLYNFGVRESTGDALILINNDMTVIEPRWVELIVAKCMQSDVGAVGAKLLYPDGTIQHAGCNVGVAGLAAHRHVGETAESVAMSDVTRELSAVTGACLGVRRDVFESIGGLDETLRVAFNDTKFCLACLERGLRNIYISEPLLHHFESKSRGFDVSKEQIELRDREAIFTRESAPDLFRCDPYYSPNLSLERIDALAEPPRRVRPWRFPTQDRPARVMLLSWVNMVGSGVALVLRMQAERLVREGFDVIVAGPRCETELSYDGCRRLFVKTPAEAATAAVRESVDCVIVHTPPFFSIARYLGAWPIVYFVDHGEPNPEFFADREAREAVDREKRFCAPLAKRVVAISNTIRDQSLCKDVIVLRNGNSHMGTWSESYEAPRRAMRAKLGWQDKFVVLNVCRFGAEERRYKGIDKYVEIAEEFSFAYPHARDKVVFALAGKANEQDVSEMESAWLHVFANISSETMRSLFAAADLYMSFSKWEGYNLGIGEALAMGLPVIASDIEAHREFPIVTTNSVRVAMENLHAQFLSASKGEPSRAPVVFDWDAPTGRLVEMIRADVHGASREE